MAGGRAWAVAPDGAGLTCLFEVTDPGPGFEPKPVTPSFYQTGGWGLYLVEQLSDRWGVIRGKATTVWFELGGLSARSGVAAWSARA